MYHAVHVIDIPTNIDRWSIFQVAGELHKLPAELCRTSKSSVRMGAAGIHRIQAVPGDPDLWVISEVDTRLEALQNTVGRSIWFGPATNNTIQLKPGDTVLDIGANVGSFARLAARVVGPSGRVIAVEPVPELFEALQRNAQLWNAQRLDNSSVCGAEGITEAQSSSVGANPPAAAVGTILPIHCGIVEDPTLTTADFTYFPRCAAFSTLASLRDDDNALASTLSLVQHDTAPPTSVLQRGARILARLLPQWYSPFHKLAFHSLFMSGVKTVACPVTTLAQLMDDLQLSTVALVKINVERAELQVLRSVMTPVHWQRIQQVSMQLHNRDGALEQAVSILKGAGQFDIVHHFQEPRFSGCCLTQVVATRSQPPRPQ